MIGEWVGEGVSEPVNNAAGFGFDFNLHYITLSSRDKEARLRRDRDRQMAGWMDGRKDRENERKGKEGGSLICVR